MIFRQNAPSSREEKKKEIPKTPSRAQIYTVPDQPDHPRYSRQSSSYSQVENKPIRDQVG
jgi:hypothetical protein